MNYFIDTEFLEGTQKESFPVSLFRKNTPPTIDLISIGIVAEDGREYYAISKDFNLKEAWNRYQMKQVYGDVRNAFPKEVKEYWIRENVLKHIYRELYFKTNDVSYSQAAFLYKGIQEGKHDDLFTYEMLKHLINHYGKTNKQIANEIVEFVYGESSNLDGLSPLQEAQKYEPNNHIPIPKFYGYFADYDWVAFCWLFGKMIELPKGFPKYCIDLKQILDEKITSLNWMFGRDIWSNSNRSIKTIGKGEFQEKDRPATFEEKLSVFKELVEYPKQENAHNALSDAKWNKKLYEFLNKM